jgi:hypothetical protein
MQLRDIPVWTNHDIVLYHGTLNTSAENIAENGVDPARFRSRRDFGSAFYVTTSLPQAEAWAYQKFETGVLHPASPPAVCRFSLSRARLAELRCLWFVRGSPDANDYWSFVRFCRDGGVPNARERIYDIVIGPVARGIRNRLVTMEDSDQAAFITDAALALLNETRPEVVSI